MRFNNINKFNIKIFLLSFLSLLFYLSYLSRLLGLIYAYIIAPPAYRLNKASKFNLITYF